MSLFEEITALSPVQFFGLCADCNYSKKKLKPDPSFLLPSTSDLLGEEPFADLYLCWDESRLAFLLVSHIASLGSTDDERKGDSLELFIDTRDLKTKGVVSRFFHHFVFSPHQIQNFYGREVTRFRGEDIHRLSHPEDLHVQPELADNSYRLFIEIPSKCLHGYDPIGFPRLGFTYRVNRSKGFPQHFAVSSEEYVIEQHPAMWGTLKLVKE